MKRQQRDRYREQVQGQRESLLAGGLLDEGVQREVELPNGTLDTVEAFTMREAAAALGRSIVTLKKWVEDELIPGPVLKDAVYGYDQYSRGELDEMAGVLSEHETIYAYLRAEHIETVQQLHRKVLKYRRSNW